MIQMATVINFKAICIEGNAGNVVNALKFLIQFFFSIGAIVEDCQFYARNTERVEFSL